MEISYGLLYGFILSIQFALGVILCFNYKLTIKHYFFEFWWTFALQIAAFVFINEWLVIKHPFVYSNTSENDMKQGVIQIEGESLSRSVALQIGVLFPLSIHCLYASSRRVLFETKSNKIKYDPSIKWIEYMISSSFQTLVLYSLYGQVGQTIWVAVGMKMFSMFSAYGFEQILLKDTTNNKNNNGVITRAVLARPRFVIFMAFAFYCGFHYGPLFVYYDDRPRWVQVFLGGMMLNDISFPLTMVYYKDDLDTVYVDIIYSIWSIISKNTFDLIIILGTKRVPNAGIILMIPASFILGGILFLILKYCTKERKYFLDKKIKIY